MGTPAPRLVSRENFFACLSPSPMSHNGKIGTDGSTSLCLHKALRKKTRGKKHTHAHTHTSPRGKRVKKQKNVNIFSSPRPRSLSLSV